MQESQKSSTSDSDRCIDQNTSSDKNAIDSKNTDEVIYKLFM